jgi:hypothetical protein
MCNCKTHARTFEETRDSRYPASAHAPSCEDYKLEKFWRITLDGTTAVATVDEFLEHCDHVKYDDDAEHYVYDEVYLTQDQYDNMIEFLGF